MGKERFGGNERIPKKELKYLFWELINVLKVQDDLFFFTQFQQMIPRKAFGFLKSNGQHSNSELAFSKQKKKQSLPHSD